MKAATRAKRKYNDANYVRIVLDVKPEVKEEIKQAAEAAGISIAGFVQEAAKEKIERDKIEREENAN